MEIQAHAVHPRGCTIYVSASGDTFAYDTTSAGRWDWTRVGCWALPFEGHAHYNRQLNKWVGLHAGEDGDGTTGYLCACEVPSSNHGEDRPLRSAGSKEKILLDDPAKRRLDLKLVYMAERGEYCLFERLRREGAAENESLDDGEECVLRLTTFRLNYECGEPDYLTIMDRRARSYKVLRYRDDFEAQAFWI
jgi:hypothetical protein